MPQHGREHISIYLPKSMAASVREEAAKRGLSLSAYVNSQLQDDFQRWLEIKFEKLEALFHANPVCKRPDAK